MLLHREGAKVNKSDPGLLAALDDLYAIIAQYDPENVYNMDKIGLFFRLLLRYSLLMLDEDISTTRGKKKSKGRVYFIVCANTVGIHKIPCTLIGKSKALACIKDRQWLVPYFSQAKAWMDVETCWKWFNEVFLPEVKKRTRRRVLLLLDNAPGHFEAFERDNVRVIFFPPNCISWKQPCDMGIIAVLKKRFKYLYLKDVLDLYELDEEAKLRKKMQGQKLRHGATGVAYGNLAHLFDAASYVKEAWQSMSLSSIKNAFIKAKIMTLEFDQEVVNMIEDLRTEVAQAITALNLFIGQDELEEFVHVDDENNEEFVATVLEDVEELLETMKIVKENLDDDNDDDILTSQASNSGLGNIVVFKGFESLYKQVVDIEDQVFCSEVREEAKETFDDLRKLFESFQSKVRVVTLKAKHKSLQNLRQMTIHDTLN
jgi:hypothetical protein